jgi:hypothetical protein
MSLRSRWKTLSPACRARILAEWSVQPARFTYGPRLMKRRQTAFHAYIDPHSQPDEIATMRCVLGSLMGRVSATRVWALRHQLRVLEALRATPSPTLP